MIWTELEPCDVVCLNGPLDYQWGERAREAILWKDPGAVELADLVERPPTDYTLQMHNTEAEVLMTAEDFIVLYLESETGYYFVPAEYIGQLSIVRLDHTEPVPAVDLQQFLSILGEGAAV